ncbi:hypothetical protein ACFE04_017761 [Oxalis oulophora]
MPPLLHHRLLRLTLLLLSLSDLSFSSQYLKLPLLHKTPPLSPSHILSLDLHRLSHNHHRPNPIKSPVTSGASTGSGQYFVNIHIGTPPKPFFLVADTGSDLIWLKCSACHSTTSGHCATVHPSEFLPRYSSTFSPIHCYDSMCDLVPQPSHTSCNHTRLQSACRYEYEYGDGSLSSGFFSHETVSLNTSSGKVTKLNNILFGCGFHVSGPSVTGANFNGAQGVMGLGRGPISLATQLGLIFGNNIFSYCLMDYTLSPPPTSYLTIGATSANDVKLKFTPLITNTLAPTFYFIQIITVFINDVKLPISPSVWSFDKFGNGGTIVDSGTTLTFLPDLAYHHILTAFKRKVKRFELPKSIESTQGFDLCVNASTESMASLPKLSFKLEGGAVFAPPPENYFIDTEDRVKCLAIQPVGDSNGFAVIGNLMQQGYLFEFDEDRSRLGFTRYGCAIQ